MDNTATTMPPTNNRLTAPVRPAASPVTHSILNGAAHLAGEFGHRWGVDATRAFSELLARLVVPGIHEPACVDTALTVALRQLLASRGIPTTNDELDELRFQFWLVAQRWMDPAARAEIRDRLSTMIS